MLFIHMLICNDLSEPVTGEQLVDLAKEVQTLLLHARDGTNVLSGRGTVANKKKKTKTYFPVII